MSKFAAQLLRLKQFLGVTKDHEVASALGMTKAAFSNRKQADSFPQEKLAELKKSRPDLDVVYILTGSRVGLGDQVVHSLMHEVAAVSGDSSLTAAVVKAIQNHAEALDDAARDAQVRDLLGILIWCDRAAIEQITLYAARLMGKQPMPFSERTDRRPSQLSNVEGPSPVAARRLRRTRPTKAG